MRKLFEKLPFIQKVLNNNKSEWQQKLCNIVANDINMIKEIWYQSTCPSIFYNWLTQDNISTNKFLYNNFCQLGNSSKSLFSSALTLSRRVCFCTQNKICLYMGYNTFFYITLNLFLPLFHILVKCIFCSKYFFY